MKAPSLLNANTFGVFEKGVLTLVLVIVSAGALYWFINRDNTKEKYYTDFMKSDIVSATVLIANDQSQQTISINADQDILKLLKHMILNSEFKGKKQKKLYDFSVNIKVFSKEGRFVLINTFHDNNSSIIHFSLRDESTFNELDGWFDDQDSMYRNMITVHYYGAKQSANN